MKTRNVVTNTAKQAAETPIIPLVEAIGHGGKGYIEASEARGQQQLVNSEVLPREALSHRNRPTLEAWGIDLGDPKVGSPVEGDELFVHAKLPAGWKKVPTDHAMWSNLVDDKGRARARIFYKAAFYDRKTGLDVCTRFRIDVEYQDVRSQTNDKRKGMAKDSDGSVLFATDWISRGDLLDGDTARDPVTAWLNENKPGWEDPTKYWDEP